MSEYREYENGVADVLAFIAGDDAEVERNVELPGKLSGVPRQLDIVVRGRIFSFAHAMLVVDCKRWREKVDVADMGSFIDLLEDVGADLGLLMTAAGESPAARARASAARGVRVATITVEQLSAWGPAGTVSIDFSVPADLPPAVLKALRDAGFRVTLLPQGDVNEAALHVFRHYGTRSPSGEIQSEHHSLARQILSDHNIEATVVSNGITIGGGTHQWLEVAIDGRPIGLKVLADTEAAVDRKLDDMASSLGVPRNRLNVIRPSGWPPAGLFGLAL